MGEGEDFLGGDDGEEEEDMPTNRQEVTRKASAC